MDESNKNMIKVGFLVSYDYQLLEYSLPIVYQYADEIYLAIDKERKTWSGNSFQLPDTFFEWIHRVDTENKIHIYEDSFYLSALSQMSLETRMRNMLAKYMGYSGWHIQIDVDEYFLNFEKFVSYLKSLDYGSPVNIYSKWITIFKQDEDGIFYIDDNEKFPVATNTPYYIRARYSVLNGTDLIFDGKVLHQSWGRSKDDLILKLKNWGHTNDMDWVSYLAFWESVGKDNYKEVKKFLPLYPPAWSELKYINANDIYSLINKMRDL